MLTQTAGPRCLVAGALHINCSWVVRPSRIDSRAVMDVRGVGPAHMPLSTDKRMRHTWQNQGAVRLV